MAPVDDLPPFEPPPAPLAGLAEALREGKEIAPAAAQEGYRYLQVIARRALGGAASSDVDDVVQTAYANLLAASRAGKLKDVSNLPGYMVTTVRRTAVDVLRRSSRRGALSSVPFDVLIDLAGWAEAPSDMNAVEIVDKVTDLFRVLRHSEDRVAYLVVTFMLDYIEKEGRAPSLRTTGSSLGMSHTSVANALERVRGVLSRIN